MILSELFNSPGAILMGVINGLIINSCALAMHGASIFLVFMVMDVVLSASRFIVARRVAMHAAQGKSVSTDLYLFTALLWCALQGATIFAMMISENPALQIIASVTAVGLMGPVCARNYAAPRLSLALSALFVLPLDIGALVAGQQWSLILLIQTPLYFYGSMMITTRFQTVAVRALIAQYESQSAALHDSLTGLWNRAGLMNRFSDVAWTASNRVILFYLDLDGFKAVNDGLGHEAGDLLLKSVAARLEDVSTDADMVARIGGDEFVIVVPRLSPAEGEARASAMIRTVTDFPYTLERNVAVGSVGIGVSVGFACYPEDGATLDELMRYADRALYDAKREGKGVNRRFAKDVPSVVPACAVDNEVGIAA